MAKLTTKIMFSEVQKEQVYLKQGWSGHLDQQFFSITLICHKDDLLPVRERTIDCKLHKYNTQPIDAKFLADSN